MQMVYWLALQEVLAGELGA